jgi:hypothetical protein
MRRLLCVNFIKVWTLRIQIAATWRKVVYIRRNALPNIQDITFFRSALSNKFLDKVFVASIWRQNVGGTKTPKRRDSRYGLTMRIALEGEKSPMDLTFMGPCGIVRIFQYISNKMQCYTVYFIWKLLYMFRVVPPPIIRSANNCIYSWYMSHQLFHDSGRYQ